MATPFKNLKSRAIGVTPITIGSYTVPALTSATVVGLSLANILTTSIAVDVIINDGVNDTYVIKNAVVPSGTALIPFGGDQKIVLGAGDKVNIVSNTAASVDAILSILETV